MIEKFKLWRMKRRVWRMVDNFVSIPEISITQDDACVMLIVLEISDRYKFVEPANVLRSLIILVRALNPVINWELAVCQAKANLEQNTSQG